MKSIRDADELMLISLNGMIVRTGVSEMRTIGRATQGVKVIGLKPGDKLVSVARVISDDSDQGALPLDNTPADPQGKLPLPSQPASEPGGEDEAPAGPAGDE
jgi:DNA gyrase subunit A